MSQDKHILPQGDATLPPAGDERREVLKRRQDALEEQLERQPAVEGGSIRPDAFKIENEIAQHFNELEVPNADPGYVYCWVNADIRRIWGNRFVVQKRAEGWEVVPSDAPDAKGLEHSRYVDGSIVVGDVVLMRCRRERAEMLRRAREEQQARTQLGVDSGLIELAQKHGINVVDLAADPRLLKMAQTRAQARQMATQQFDQMLRQGTVPGAERR